MESNFYYLIEMFENILQGFFFISTMNSLQARYQRVNILFATNKYCLISMGTS